MNLTFKQLEAFYFSVKLGSFSAAAARLHTTQSAISKRVSEFEAVMGARLLHRQAHGLVATEIGRRVTPLAEESLRLKETIAMQAGEIQALRGHYRLGVTDLIAMTWLTTLVTTMQASHPDLILEPVVDAGMNLFESLQANDIHLAIMPGTYWGKAFRAVRIAQVETAWMASPRLALPDRPLLPAEFADYPVLEQSSGSAKNHFYEAWQARHGFRFKRIFSTNHLGVLGELTIDGLGISQLSCAYFNREIEQGLLRVVRSDPMPPPMVYSAVYRDDDFNAATNHIVVVAARLCDFTLRSRTGQPVPPAQVPA